MKIVDRKTALIDVRINRELIKQVNEYSRLRAISFDNALNFLIKVGIEKEKSK